MTGENDETLQRDNISHFFSNIAYIAGNRKY